MRGVSTGAGTRKLSAGALSAARRIGWAATAFGTASSGSVRFQRAANEMDVIAARISTGADTDPVTSDVADSVMSNVACFGAALKDASSNVACFGATSKGAFCSTHSRCFGAGNGLENASGSATTKTDTPHNIPAVRPTQTDISARTRAPRLRIQILHVVERR